MKKICSWCNKPLGQVESAFHGEETITHGICSSCLNNIFSNDAVDFIPFLNSLEAPVVLIDDQNNYISANDTARTLLEKEHIELIEQRMGTVFSCENAHLPGGCGHTENCGGCQLLNAVRTTHSGLINHHHVPINLILDKNGKREELYFKLSTQKVNDLILLKLDEYYK